MLLDYLLNKAPAKLAMLLDYLLNKAPAKLFGAGDRSAVKNRKLAGAEDNPFLKIAASKTPTTNLSEDEANAMTAAAKELKTEAIASMGIGVEAVEETVSFDVGGQVFKVARSTLDLYPETMLARAASKEWGKTGFIDRDAVRFRYVLDWMRDREVNLPMTESREAFIKELQYFGFADIDEGSVSLGTVAEAGKVMAAVAGNVHGELDDLSEAIAKWKKKIENAQEKQEAIKLAHSIFIRSASVQVNGNRFTVRIKEGEDLSIARSFVDYNGKIRPGENRLRDCLLRRYGFVLESTAFEKSRIYDSKHCDFVLKQASSDKAANLG